MFSIVYFVNSIIVKVDHQSPIDAGQNLNRQFEYYFTEDLC